MLRQAISVFCALVLASTAATAAPDNIIFESWSAEASIDAYVSVLDFGLNLSDDCALTDSYGPITPVVEELFCEADVGYGHANARVTVETLANPTWVLTTATASTGTYLYGLLENSSAGANADYEQIYSFVVFGPVTLDLAGTLSSTFLNEASVRLTEDATILAEFLGTQDGTEVPFDAVIPLDPGYYSLTLKLHSAPTTVFSLEDSFGRATGTLTAHFISTVSVEAQTWGRLKNLYR